MHLFFSVLTFLPYFRDTKYRQHRYNYVSIFYSYLVASAANLSSAFSPARSRQLPLHLTITGHSERRTIADREVVGVIALDIEPEAVGVHGDTVVLGVVCGLPVGPVGVAGRVAARPQPRAANVVPPQSQPGIVTSGQQVNLPRTRR